MGVWSVRVCVCVCECVGGRQRNRECGSVLIVSHHGRRMCLYVCAYDRLGELRRLNTVVDPSVATGNHGGGPRLTVTRVTVPIARHWDLHPLSQTHTEHTRVLTFDPFACSHLSFASLHHSLSGFPFKYNSIPSKTNHRLSQNECHFSLI